MYVGSRTGALSFREMFRPPPREFGSTLAKSAMAMSSPAEWSPAGTSRGAHVLAARNACSSPFFLSYTSSFFNDIDMSLHILTSISGRQATLRLGEEVTEKQPLVSVNEKFRLELYGSKSPEKATVS